MVSDLKGKIASGYGFSIGGTLIVLGLHFLSMKLLAEYMPVEDFGVFALLMAVSQGFVVFSGCGMALTLVKQIAADPGEERERFIIANALFVRLILLFVLSLIVLLAGRSLMPQVLASKIQSFVYYLPCMFSLALLRETLFNLLQGRQQFHWFALIKIIAAAARLSAILWLARSSRLGVQELIWVEVLTSVSAVVILVFLTRVLSLIRLKVLRSGEMKGLLRESLPLYANDIFTYVYSGATLLLLGVLLASVEVGLFSAASRVPQAFLGVFLAMVAVYFPTMSKLVSAGKTVEARQWMHLALPTSSSGLCLVALFSLLFRDEIVRLLFAEQYIPASNTLALLMLNCVFTCIGQLMSFTAVAAGHASVPLRVNCAASASNILACLLLIPQWGIAGAVAAQFVGSVLALVIYGVKLNRFNYSPNVLEAAVPLVIGGMIALVYETSAWSHLGFRGTLLFAYIVLCWLLVPRLRKLARVVFKLVAEYGRTRVQVSGRS